MRRVIVRTILAVCFSAIGVGITYLAGSFIAWDFNPGQWDPFGRFCALALGISSGFGGFLAPFDDEALA